MENKTRSRVMLAITLFSAIVLSGTVFVCARRAGEEVTQRSFDELTTATKQLAKDINNATRTDQTILSAMAELIAGQDERDNDAVLRIMKSFSLSETFVSTFPAHSILKQRRRGARTSQTASQATLRRKSWWCATSRR